MANNAFDCLRRPAILFFLAALACLPAANAFANTDADAGISAKDTAKWRLAIQAASRQSLENLESLSLSNASKAVEADLAERLNAYMLQNPAECRTDAQARQVCWWAIRELKKAEFQAAVSNAAKNAQELSPLPLDSSDLFAKLGPGWTARVESAIGLFLTNRFESIYTLARRRAVALQRQAMEAAVRFPAQEELETKLRRLAEIQQKPEAKITPNEFDSLKPWTAGRFAPDPALLFEETSIYIGDLGDRMLEEIKNQYYFQFGVPENLLASNAAPLNCITLETINADFQEALEKATASARAARARMAGISNIPIYEVFASARDYAKSMAQRLEQERAVEFIRNTPALAPDAGKIEAALKRDPETHRSPAASTATFMSELGESLRAQAALEYVRNTAGPPRPESEDAKLCAYFDREFASTSTIASAFTDRLQSELSRILPPLREQLAATQFKNFFASLSSDAPLAEQALETVLDRKRAPARALKQVADFMEAAGLACAPPGERAKCLDETAALVVEAWNHKTANALKAFDAQTALLRQIETDRLAQLERDVAAEKPVDAILKDWTRALEQAWATRASDEAPEFAGLFNRTLADLDKTVRRLYDARRKEQTPASAASAAPSATSAQTIPANDSRVQPEEKTANPFNPPQPAKAPQPKPNAVLPEPEHEDPNPTHDAGAPADVALVFTDTTDGRTIAVWTTCEPPGAGEAMFEAANIEDAVTAILSAMRSDLERVLDIKSKTFEKPKYSFLFFSRRPQAPDLKFSISIKSRAVRHQMSLLLRQEIAGIADEWAKRNGLENIDISLNWKVGL